MLYINEWLPNPVGSDAQGEWVEFWNDGSLAINLNGWLIKTQSGDKYIFSSEKIDGGGSLVLKRSATKLVLKNTDEKIFLYNDKGQLVDESAFFGSAPEGKSFSRIAGANDFVWSAPTPGGTNQTAVSNIINNIYPLGQPLNKNSTIFEFLGLALISAAIITSFIIFILKRNENLSKLFFGRD